MMKQYSNYKSSDVDWIGELPSHWSVSSLYRCIDPGRRLTYGIVQAGPKLDQGIPYIRPVDMTEKGIPPVAELPKTTPEIAASYARSAIAPGDLVMSIGPSFGKVAMAREEHDGANLTQGTARIAIAKELHARYFFWLLQSKDIHDYWTSIATGATFPALNLEPLGRTMVPVPAAEEQQAIAAFLDNQTDLIDQLIEKNTKLLELLDDQRKAIINEAVTKGLDPKAPMKDSGVEWLGEVPKHWELARLKRHFTIQKRIAGELGYDVLSVTQRGLRVKDLDNLQGQHSMDYTKYQLVYPGDFVMNHMDLLTGYVDLSNQTGVTSPDYRVFTATSEGVDNMFYLFLFQLGYFRRIFYGMGRGVSDIGRWRLPATEFNDFMIPVPPLEEQHRIATHLSEQRATLDILGTQTTDLIDRLKEYRQSIISEAVTGKIDLREWQPEPLSLA